jgi:hypothetical protein
MAVTSMANSSIRNLQKYRSMSSRFGAPPYLIEYVIIGGGGSSSSFSGGGGAGGYRSSVTGESSGGGASAELPASINKGTFSIQIGAGGAATSETTLEIKGTSGGNSSVFGIVSLGGGAAASSSGPTVNDRTPNIGGSGGGVGYRSGTGAVGTPSQGFAGGDSHSVGEGSVDGGGGGGGGAGGAGVNGGFRAGGNGGVGVSSSITGSSVERAGGGAASGDARNATPTNGTATGGGGAASTGDSGNQSNTSGTTNTGGGAGGGAPGGIGRNGGSGIILLKVPVSALVTFSGGVAQTVTTIGLFNIFSITAAGPTDTVTIG